MKRWSPTRLGISLAAAVLVVAACAPAGTGSPAAPAPDAPTVPQKLTIGQSSITPTMMPYISICCTQRRYDVYDMVVGQKADGSVEPMVATAWKVVDPTIWEFTTRTDLKFHDATALTVDDVVFSINRAIDPQFKYAITNRLQTIAKAELINPTTVRVTTKNPDPLLLKRIALVSVLPKAYLEKVGDTEFSAKPIGSGPFRVKEYVPDDRVVVVATETHPFRKATGISEVTIRSISEPSARVAGLKTGDLDIIDGVPIDQVDTLKGAGFQLLPIDAGGSSAYWIDTVLGDQPRTGPTANKLVRQALNYAVDKDTIARNIYKGLTKVEQGQILQPESFGYNPRLKPYPYDPAKAKQLLAQAGYPNGFKVNIAGQFASNREDQAMVLFVQDQLKAINVELAIETIGEYAIYRDYFYGDRTRPDIFAPGQVINRPAMDADFAFVWFWSGQVPGSRHYKNPEYDRLYQASTTELDIDKRLALLKQAAEVMNEDPPSLFLIQGLFLIAHKANLKGFEKRTDREARYDQLRFG
ncbi:MAG: ABC transporter substrate-binding protein [Dehalococcoidia bacterium]